MSEKTRYATLLGTHNHLEAKARDVRNTLAACYTGKLDKALTVVQVTIIEVALRAREDALAAEIAEGTTDLDNAKAAYDFALDLGECTPLLADD